MTAVTALPSTNQRGRPFTEADLASMPEDGRHYAVVDGALVVTGGTTRAYLETTPDDGRRYELIDGVLIVTPAPGLAHQRAVLRLVVLLDATAPPDVEVVVAPFDVVLDDATVVEPDVVVARRSDLTAKNLPAAPLLAVEVLSKSTRRIDRTRKFEKYQRSGIRAYWLVDPLVPSLVAWELRDGAYVQVAEVNGAEAFTTSVPFDVTVVPAELVSAERPR
jgi:Uma2 family endonuclease